MSCSTAQRTWGDVGGIRGEIWGHVTGRLLDGPAHRVARHRHDGVGEGVGQQRGVGERRGADDGVLDRGERVAQRAQDRVPRRQILPPGEEDRLEVGEAEQVRWRCGGGGGGGGDGGGGSGSPSPAGGRGGAAPTAYPLDGTSATQTAAAPPRRGGLGSHRRARARRSCPYRWRSRRAAARGTRRAAASTRSGARARPSPAPTAASAAPRAGWAPVRGRIAPASAAGTRWRAR